MMKLPIFCIVGRAGCGKTLFLEQLLPQLAAAGLKVGTFKTSGRTVELAYPASDSARLAKAGAFRSVLLHRDGVLVFHDKFDEQRAFEMACLDCDLILVEGQVMGEHPVIEVVRAGEPFFSAEDVWMSVTERPLGRRLEVDGAAAAAEEILKRMATDLVCKGS